MNRNLIVASFAALAAVFAFAASPASAKETPKPGAAASCCAMACCKPGAACCAPGASCCGSSCCGTGCCGTKAKAQSTKAVKAKAMKAKPAAKVTFARVTPRA